MSDMTLRDQIEHILAYIGTARRTIQDGKFVDLRLLESDVAVLHETIAKDPNATDGMSTDDLMSFLNSIMEGLEQLDKDVRSHAEAAGIKVDVSETD